MVNNSRFTKAFEIRYCYHSKECGSSSSQLCQETSAFTLSAMPRVFELEVAAESRAGDLVVDRISPGHVARTSSSRNCGGGSW